MINQGGVEMRIAIIEDDEITRLELSKLLNTQGYGVKGTYPRSTYQNDFRV